MLKIAECEELKVASLMYDGRMVYGNYYGIKQLVEKMTLGVEEDFLWIEYDMELETTQ